VTFSKYFFCTLAGDLRSSEGENKIFVIVKLLDLSLTEQYLLY